MTESYLVGALLAFAGGFIDAYTYITRDEVFAYAQTGNIVLLGINIGKTNYLQALLYLIPIFTFIIGVFLAERFKKSFPSNGQVWRQIVVVTEIIIIIIVCFIPYGKSTNPVAIVLSSFISALQYEAFRSIRGQAFASTMCTGNLRSGAESLYHYIHTREKSYRNKTIQYFGIIIIFAAGAAVGTALTGVFELKAALFSIIFLAGAFIALFFDKSII